MPSISCTVGCPLICNRCVVQVLMCDDRRYSMVIVDNEIKSFNVEADGTGLTCSLSNVIMDQL